MAEFERELIRERGTAGIAAQPGKKMYLSVDMAPLLRAVVIRSNKTDFLLRLALSTKFGITKGHPLG